MHRFLREFWLFGLKQAYACMFGGYLLGLIFLTNYWYPFSLPRYDFLFLAAVAFQLFLLAFKFETPKEAIVIVLFHCVATGMELFKTSDAIGSWHYPEAFYFGIGNFPLFAGFMYSAVGSYLARIWRIFEFRYSAYPEAWKPVVLVVLIYINFFTHHYFYDLRWILLAASVILFGRTYIYFKVDQVYRRMPLSLGWLLVALFIWFGENIGTYSRAWVYPDQSSQWHMVSPSKLLAWYLLMMLSFVLVSFVHKPKFVRLTIPSGKVEHAMSMDTPL
jgi:uncharacterized membrane protein YoaT (DUF817 family)